MVRINPPKKNIGYEPKNHEPLKLQIKISDGLTIRPITNYELKNGFLMIHELGQAYVLSNQEEQKLRDGQELLYTDSIYPLTKNGVGEIIVKKWISVKMEKPNG